MCKLLKYLNDVKSPISIILLVLFINLPVASQSIYFKDIKVYSNFDSLVKVAKLQKGKDKLKTLLSIEKSYTYWTFKKERSFDQLDSLIQKHFPNEIHYLYFFKAQYAHFISRNSSLAFQLATKALPYFKNNKDTTGQIYTLTLMGMISFTRDYDAAKYQTPYFMDAYKLSLNSNNIEDKLFGNYSRIRHYGDSTLARQKEIIYFATKSLELIKKHPYYEYLGEAFFSTLGVVYWSLKKYDLAFYYDQQIIFLYQKNKVPIPLMDLSNFAHDNFDLKKYAQAKMYYELAIKNIYTYKSTDYLGISLVYLYYHKTLVALGKYKEASVYTDSAYNYLRKYRITENIKNINETAAKYQTKEKEQENLLLQKEKEAIASRNQLYLIIGLLSLITLLIVTFFAVRLKRKTFELETANNNIVQLNKLKEYFLSIVVHDLRLPIISLNGIYDTAKYYLDSKNYGAVDKMIHALNDSGIRLQNMLDNLLKWAATQSEEVPYKPQIVDIYDCIQDTLNLYKNLIVHKQIEVRLKCEKQVKLYADPNGLSLIFRNLLGNALKFTKSNNGMILIEVEQVASQTTIKISDNGPGIEETKLKTVKTVLETPDKVHPGEEGIGLGILLVSRFVKRNKGNINVKSNPNEGTTFTISFLE